MRGTILLLFSSMLATGVIGGPIRKAAMADQEAVPQSSSTSTKVGPKTPISLLYPRIGTWDVTIRTEPTKASQQKGFDKGVATITKGPGGFSVVQEFWSRGTSGHVQGQSYTWWDGTARTYKSVWCDNTQGCTEFTTNLSGRSWVVELNNGARGGKTHTQIRATMSEDLRAIHEEVTTTRDDGPATLESVSEYVRAPSKANREGLRE